MTLSQKVSVPLARVALFIIFFWFGFLKIVDQSPANLLVQALLAYIIPFISFEQFRIFLGLYEMAIGLAFVIPRAERVAIALLIPHMLATFLPLLVLSEITWQSLLIPTFEGQYIIKNVVIIALALSLAARRGPSTS